MADRGGDGDVRAAAVVDALVTNLFLHPALVRVAVNYWCHACTPLLLEPRHVPDEPAGLAALRTDFAALLAHLTAPIADVQLYGEAMVLPTATAHAPRPLFVLSFALATHALDLLPLVLPLPDTLWAADGVAARAGAPVRLVNLPLTSMALGNARYWTSVGDGGMRGAVVAKFCRHTARARVVAHPPVLVGHACALLVAQLRARCAGDGDTALFDALAPLVLRVMGEAVGGVRWAPSVPAEERDITTALGAMLANADSTLAARLAALDRFVANMDALCRAQYAALRDAGRAALPLGDHGPMDSAGYAALYDALCEPQ